jgi:hypothetical protein
MLNGPSSTSWFFGSSSGTRPGSPGVLPESNVPPGISTRSLARGCATGLCDAGELLALGGADGAAPGPRLPWQPRTPPISSAPAQAR